MKFISSGEIREDAPRDRLSRPYPNSRRPRTGWHFDLAAKGDIVCARLTIKSQGYGLAPMCSTRLWNRPGRAMFAAARDSPCRYASFWSTTTLSRLKT